MANPNASGRVVGTLAFPVKPYLEGLMRAKLGIAANVAPTEKQAAQIKDGMKVLRSELEAEKDLELTDAPQTRALVDLFLAQLRAGFERPIPVTLRGQLAKRDEEIAQLRAELERLKKPAKKKAR